MEQLVVGTLPGSAGEPPQTRGLALGQAAERWFRIRDDRGCEQVEEREVARIVERRDGGRVRRGAELLHPSLDAAQRTSIFAEHGRLLPQPGLEHVRVPRRAELA